MKNILALILLAVAVPVFAENSCVLTGAGELVCGVQVQVTEKNNGEVTLGSENKLCKPGDAQCENVALMKVKNAFGLYEFEATTQGGYHACMDNGGYHDDCKHLLEK